MYRKPYFYGLKITIKTVAFSSKVCNPKEIVITQINWEKEASLLLLPFYNTLFSFLPPSPLTENDRVC